MDIAIVTGAETPLGLRIIKRLVQQGCRVHGIGNNFSNVSYADPNFIGHAIDLTDLKSLQAKASEIIETEQRINILIHAIDVTPGTAFEKLPAANLEAILNIGLLGPVMLTRFMLPNLLRFRGQLINIIPTNKSGNKSSAVNALIKGGLREMNHALFDQARDAGLRVTNVVLRQNESLPAGDAKDDQLIQSRIDPEHVARVIEQLTNENEPNVPNEISLCPRLSPSAKGPLPTTVEPIDPYSTITLPPKEYCPPEPEPIPTKEPEPVERVVPYSDEELEDRIAAAIEDFENKPQRQNRLHPESPSGENNEGASGKKKRRRRRGGRNRNRSDNQSEDGQSPKKQAEPQSDSSEGKATQPQESSNQPASKSGDHAEPKGPSKNGRRRGGGKPKAEDGDSTAGNESAPKGNEPKGQPALTELAAKAPEVSDSKSAEKPAKKAAKKKTAKKTVKKKAAKRAAKKTAKEKATPKTDD
ncbi:MAG: SDR family NAD(P)-dependent oxidoreductase [Verrucomicrobiota bacterium]